MPAILAALLIGGTAAPVLLWEKGFWVALASAPLGGSALAGAVAVVRAAARSRRVRTSPSAVPSPRLRNDPGTGIS
ncbi:hypothetical protein FHS82_001882 [Pseudochelatococcus lubricantis]|uniref:Uncharacterized protein n=1 Tax=Pseudochelatococcus lubricantis TaxID=1538102 RepID=A0ABX0UYL8_9HYPH|nr:hypothetical protein [Pseudochelatococcus lubricantis]NIJ58046.1 hypothetical protein [Pseudochelatococcus lubricantis]